MMESGGVSSLFPKTLGDMFATTGESGALVSAGRALCLSLILQRKMPSSFVLTTTSHMVRRNSSLLKVADASNISLSPFKVENVPSEREDNLNLFMHHVGTKFHLQPPPPREPFKPLQFVM
jgi:hypothetical protein